MLTVHSFTAQFLVLADQEPPTPIHSHIKHTITRTNWLSLLLTLTLSICLLMTVGLSSTLWCSLFLWVCLPKWSVCVSQSECVKLVQNVNARACEVCLKRLWIRETNTHCLHVLFVYVDVWVSVLLCFFLHLHLQCFRVWWKINCWWESNGVVDASFFLFPEGKVLLSRGVTLIVSLACHFPLFHTLLLQFPFSNSHFPLGIYSTFLLDGLQNPLRKSLK